MYLNTTAKNTTSSLQRARSFKQKTSTHLEIFLRDLTYFCPFQVYVIKALSKAFNKRHQTKFRRRHKRKTDYYARSGCSSKRHVPIWQFLKEISHIFALLRLTLSKHWSRFSTSGIRPHSAVVANARVTTARAHKRPVVRAKDKYPSASLPTSFPLPFASPYHPVSSSFHFPLSPIYLYLSRVCQSGSECIIIIIINMLNLNLYLDASDYS